MDFELSDEQKTIRDTVRKFAETKIKPLAHEQLIGSESHDFH